MKRKICCLVLLFVLFSLSVAHGGTLKFAPIGNAESIISAAAVYCNKWDELIGSAVGYHMAFNESRTSVVQKKHIDMGGNMVTTVDIDGIHMNIDDNMTVYTIQVPVRSGEKEQYVSTARIFAVINAIAYDYPSSDAEMSQRYMDCLSEYLAFMEENKDLLASSNVVYWTIETEKGVFEFRFVAISGRIRMLYDKMYFED